MQKTKKRVKIKEKKEAPKEKSKRELAIEKFKKVRDNLNVPKAKRTNVKMAEKARNTK